MPCCGGEWGDLAEVVLSCSPLRHPGGAAEVTYKLVERALWWPERNRTSRLGSRSAVKCLAEACWQEVSNDCDGPDREDREGYRYSITCFCLSHAVLLEPMRSLTHGEKCVFRSRTLPMLIRSDRGVGFKNPLNALLRAEQRFSMALRPCEMGPNERVHQEVQKVVGALVRQVGALEAGSGVYH